MNIFIERTRRIRSVRAILAIFAFLYTSVLVDGARIFDNPQDPVRQLIPYNVQDQLVSPNTDQHEQSASEFVSDHEIPKHIQPTKVKIVENTATPAAADSNISVGFVPKQTYIQVRRYDAEVHLPRSVALQEARNEEELVNAPRLTEVISHTRKQEEYQIGDAMKQIAPLKASQVEINNLMKTGDIDIENLEDAVDDASNSYFDLSDFAVSTQFPEPHERLYYYVVDDDDNE